jgi:Ser/Thr protein kinase RdoA (MazF antagonist)
MLDVQFAGEVARRYGLGQRAELSGPVARGEMGQVWKLTTPSGSWAVKELFEPPTKDEADADAAYQDAAYAAGAPMPAVARTTDGDVLAVVGSATIRVYDWVDFGDRRTPLDPVDIGRLIATIHRIDHVVANPVDPWYTDPVGAGRWDELVGQLTLANAPFARQLAQVRDEFVALEELLEQPTSLQTCHRDLSTDNIVRAASGLCVIDWESSGPADPSQELAGVLREFGDSQAERVRRLYRSYIDAGGRGRVDHPGHFTMSIAAIGRYCEVSCQRWLDDSRRVDRQSAADVVEHLVTHPLTRHKIDEMLDAISE